MVTFYTNCGTGLDNEWMWWTWKEWISAESFHLYSPFSFRCYRAVEFSVSKNGYIHIRFFFPFLLVPRIPTIFRATVTLIWTKLLSIYLNR